MEKHPGVRTLGPSSVEAPKDAPPSYRELGIGYTQAHRWQLEAAVPEGAPSAPA
jgi:hypothetical protein